MGFKIGAKVSEEMSDYINMWTDVSDFREVSKEHETSTELIRGLLRQDRRLTQLNIPILIDVLRIAIKNRNNRASTLNATHKKAVKLVGIK